MGTAALYHNNFYPAQTQTVASWEKGTEAHTPWCWWAGDDESGMVRMTVVCRSGNLF